MTPAAVAESRTVYNIIRNRAGLFYRRGPGGPHWTKEPQQATRFEFETIADAEMVRHGYGLEEYVVEHCYETRRGAGLEGGA